MTTSLTESGSFRDAKGNVARVTFQLIDLGTAATNFTSAINIRNATDALSNAADAGWHGPYTSNDAGTTFGTAATYEDVEDKAVMVFATAAGGIHRYSIPAPLSAIFLADAETVDQTNSLVKVFVANVLAATFNSQAPTAGSGGAGTREGTILTAFLGGYRARRKLKRKFTIYTRNPALTGPGL